jgi:hypothetical protein
MAATLAPVNRTVGSEFSAGTMAKRRPNTRQIRLDSDVAQTADVIAAALGKSTPEFLSDFLRPLLDKELPKALAELKKRKAASPE